MTENPLQGCGQYTNGPSHRPDYNNSEETRQWSWKIKILLCVSACVGMVAGSFIFSRISLDITRTYYDNDAAYQQRLFSKDINIMLAATSSVSFVSSILMVTFITKFVKRKNLLLKLLMAMGVTDAGFALKFMISSVMVLKGDLYFVNNLRINDTTSVSWQCYLMAFMGQFFGLASISWNFVISVLLFFIIAAPIYFRDTQDYFLNISFVFVIGFPLGTCLYGYFQGAMAYTEDGTCWLVGDYVLLFYVPLFVFVLFSIFTVIFTVVIATRNDFTEEEKNGLFPKIAFTILFIAVWTLGAILRMMTMSNESDLGIVFASTFFLGACGFFNFLLVLPIIHQQLIREDEASLFVRVTRAIEFTNIGKTSSGGSLIWR